jgi:RNA polymerase sigma-70 factor (ECF subfamily)
MESARIEIEDLLQESRWLRRLARHLVADPAEADDVAQQTYLAALTSPPPVDREVRPWLTRVARNVIRSRYRTDRRRRRREKAAVELADVAAPDLLLEQVELQRLLAELVAELPEPYRAVIVLRFYRDCSAADIATAVLVPAATIRWRIQRGLELLRAGLDRRHGGRGDWRPALTAFARLPQRTAPASGTAAVGPLASIAPSLGLFAAAALAIGALAGLAIDLRGDTPALAAATRGSDPQEPAAHLSGASSIDDTLAAPRDAHGEEAPGHAAPRDARGERLVGADPPDLTDRADGTEPRVTEMVWPLSSVDLQGRLQELEAPFAECVNAALERSPLLNGGAVFEIAVVADPEAGAQVESAELMPVAGDPPDEELVECLRETSFALELERPHWFVGRTLFHFPILLGGAHAEPYAMDGPGPIGRAVLERMRRLERRQR